MAPPLAPPLRSLSQTRAFPGTAPLCSPPTWSPRRPSTRSPPSSASRDPLFRSLFRGPHSGPHPWKTRPFRSRCWGVPEPHPLKPRPCGPALAAPRPSAAGPGSPAAPLRPPSRPPLPSPSPSVPLRPPPPPHTRGRRPRPEQSRKHFLPSCRAALGALSRGPWRPTPPQPPPLPAPSLQPRPAPWAARTEAGCWPR